MPVVRLLLAAVLIWPQASAWAVVRVRVKAPTIRSNSLGTASLRSTLLGSTSLSPVLPNADPVLLPPTLVAPVLPTKQGIIPGITPTRAEVGSPVQATVAPTPEQRAVYQEVIKTAINIGRKEGEAAGGPRQAMHLQTLYSGSARSSGGGVVVAADAIGPSLPGFDAFRFEDGGEEVDERRSTGLLFVDVAGSTKLYNDIGNTRAQETVAGYLEYAAGVAFRHGGEVVRRLGDGLLVMFPATDLAVDAALAVQAQVASLAEDAGLPSLGLHVSAHGGRVIIERRNNRAEVYGRAVERVMQMGDLSRDGEVVLDRKVMGEKHSRTGASQRIDGDELHIKPQVDGEFRLGVAGVQRQLNTRSITKASTLFVDLKDWSNMYDLHGRRPSFATAKSFQAFVRTIVEAHGGQVVKTSGEALMIGFTRPAAAILAAAEIQRRVEELRKAAPLGAFINIRTGISYGRVVIEERLDGVDFFGNSVNAAARLMGRNSGGEVLVSGAVLADPKAREMFRESDFDSHLWSLKGFDRRVTVFRVNPHTLAGQRVQESLSQRLGNVAQDVMHAVQQVRKRDRD
jgi:class 3 adenylate cyclase